MAKSILKYQLNFPGLTELELPVSKDSFGHPDVLSVRVQDKRNIVVYVRVDDPSAETEKLSFFCAETGIETLPDPKPEEGWWFLETCMLGDGSYVIHVFVRD